MSTTVTADIHDHVVKPMRSDLPDLLPRPEPPRGRHYSEEQEARWVIQLFLSMIQTSNQGGTLLT